MFLLNGIIRKLLKSRYTRLIQNAQKPAESQDFILKYLVKRAAETEFGKKYGFNAIRSYTDFKQRIPLHDYDDFRSYTIRVKQGERNVLWPGETRWFAKSSGTTSDKSKFIPVTSESLRMNHYRGGKDLYSVYFHHHPGSRIFSGKCLSIGGSHRINNFSNRSRYGDISAVMVQNLPWWAEMNTVPSKKIALMDDWEAKIDAIIKTTLRQNITGITGVPSWTLVLLKKILEMAGKKIIPEIWPNLELFVHGAVSFTPYREQFAGIIPSAGMHYLETYNASEGFFAIQDDLSDRGMLLLTDHGIFYEFIPIDAAGKENPEVCLPQDVALNKNYAIVISTNGGLWRYKIGDTVKFTSLNPLRVTVSGRTRNFINAFGEELIIDNAEKAISSAAQKTGSAIRDFTAAPVYMNATTTGAHEWLIEFDKPPQDIEKFASVLDTALMEVNSDYEAKRFKNLALRPPVVHNLPVGTFEIWLKKKGKLGGQHKVPRLFNDRRYVEELLAMVREKNI
ncbi:MAG: GH3 auxin-responsive promoter family protein [Bacteroidetes bacterium]|nr:GH3 auxin-responsive promoter family protein [Bacteroidota bacterium]